MSLFHTAIYLIILLILALPFVAIGTMIVWAARRRGSMNRGPAPETTE